jgi:hypothetical protein
MASGGLFPRVFGLRSVAEGRRLDESVPAMLRGKWEMIGFMLPVQHFAYPSRPLREEVLRHGFGDTPFGSETFFRLPIGAWLTWKEEEVSLVGTQRYVHGAEGIIILSPISARMVVSTELSGVTAVICLPSTLDSVMARSSRHRQVLHGLSSTHSKGQVARMKCGYCFTMILNRMLTLFPHPEHQCC